MLESAIPFLVPASLAALVISALACIFLKSRKAEAVASTVLFALILISSAYMIAANYDVQILGIFHVYAFSLLFALLFSIAMMLVNILAYAYSKDYLNLSLLLSFSMVGLLVVAMANSILSIFLGLELVAITTSFMILFEGRHRVEAAVKFFIMSSISISLFSFALAMLLPYSPQLALTAVMPNSGISGAYFALAALALLVVAFGFDSALFPFNLWVPDVYEGAPTYITALLAGVNKKLAFVALIEVFFVVLFAYSSTFSGIFALLAILTMFFGNLLALVQKSVKRMFAYSSISQAGYILIGISTATQAGLGATLFYIVAHTFMIIGAFAIVLWLGSSNIRNIDEYSGLGSRNGFIAASLAVLMLSMAGIPPLIGFAGKFLLFSSALSAGMPILAVMGIINSFISIYYYSKVINSMYSRKQGKRLRAGPYIAAVVLVCVLVVVLFGIFPQPLITIASNASHALLGLP
jgi:NADH-quinone oxidoreductase subunit N